MRHIMVEQQALRVEYTIKHSFMDRIVFGKGEIISPFPFFSALRRPKLAEPLPLFRIMYDSLKIGGDSLPLLSIGSPYIIGTTSKIC
jgi:hypothetical protein